ncbi:HlyC/CorC family transporter [Solirubrobacter sp. CPCC 204708]|uniref:Hemolysin family protein n=1 Tax=Solirubrobacter deserti TaxID=2282478 RepID=A0ABT4RP34_9ACTN|nr:hemolysin family protein [Solirubrobacter deserti]MBE2318420.1 HlyC/CorC family transporter [Solirubrobacter deserti]MDA0140061.1 hemolysin family protein [Solirubrobacter deserti]
MIALLLLAVFVLILLNAFFVAAEFALVRSRKAHLQTDADEGKRGAATAVNMMDDLSRYLSAAQVGITLTSLGLGFLGEPAIGQLIEDIVGEEVPHWLSTVISVGLAYLITTSFHITLGEQVPKIYAIQKAEVVARWCARPLLIFTRVFSPFISALNATSNGILRLVGVKTAGQLDEGESPEELRVLIQESVTGGKLDPGEAGMLTGVFHLHEQQARQVMTPAPAVITVDTSEDVETALRRCVSSGHTRLVVTEDENRDRVKGIVHSNQLAQLLLTEGPEAKVEGLVREIPIVPETKPLDDLLADLQRARSSLAVVIDEYGRTAGIVTVEDIIEEVVGEIDDETDPQGGEVRRLANGDWFVRGHVAITDLIDYGLELPVDSDAYNSVGGFVFGELGRLPKRGDTVVHNGYSIRVESVRENRIEAVRIRNRSVPKAEPNVQS